MPATPTERPAPALQIAVATGITAAQAAANVAAVGAAMRRGDPLVACGCWPRYIDRCRCPDNASRLPL